MFLAFTAEQKAKVRSAVAGERLAELQFMLAKDSTNGIRVALQGVSDNLKRASLDLSEARLKGKDVKLLAKSTNDSIKEKLKKLSVLEESATGEMKAQVKAAREALKIAKVEVEDSLSEDELENEIEDDLENEIEDHVRIASDSSRGLEHAIDVLSKLASQAALKEQTRREEALRHAIEVKNEALRRQHERLLEIEERKQRELLKVREEASDQAREAILKSREAALRFQESQKKADEIKSQSGSSGSNSQEGSSSSGSSESENSGSGSSNSGSDRSGSNSGEN